YGGFVLFLSAINENTIFVRLKFNPTESLLRIPSMSSNYRDGEIMTIILDKEQAFNLMQCSYKAPRKSPDLTGTHLSGSDSFGVITGSCNNYLPNVIVCAEEKNTDYISDMALPLETYGRYFIIFERGTRTSDTRLAIVISSEPNTTIRVDQSDKYIVSMLDPGTRILLHNFPKEHYALRASKPCACYLMLPSTCGKIAFGDGSLTVVPPNELFFNIYMWSFQTETYTPDMQTYVILIVHKWYINSTQINDTFIHNKFVVSWNKVMGNNDWLVGAIQLEGGTHIAHLTSSLYKFGCYIYVSSEGFGFISSAGFILASINTDFKKCIATNGTDRYDYIDNDCDGRIDEEIKNDIGS
uniref:IgGFc-binding protein N-terminal domain-containing protein n=1 Tax=Biomphalaria glabrata TaxID=6526 RepID=A0A2C9KP88_BIOGL